MDSYAELYPTNQESHGHGNQTSQRRLRLLTLEVTRVAVFVNHSGDTVSKSSPLLSPQPQRLKRPAIAARCLTNSRHDGGILLECCELVCHGCVRASLCCLRYSECSSRRAQKLRQQRGQPLSIKAASYTKTARVAKLQTTEQAGLDNGRTIK